MNPNNTTSDEASAPTQRSSPRGRTVLLLLLAGAAAVALIAVVLAARSDATSGQTSTFAGQGGSEPPLAEGGAHLTRDAAGLQIQVVVPTPAAGSYEYPTADMVPPGASHPKVVAGSADEPEVFTLWAFAFNFPDRCSDDACDSDDIGDTPARGGVFQVDGRVAEGSTLEFAGSVLIGQPPVAGSTLEDQYGAEFHLAIAPHGKFLSGVDGWTQLNGSIGNPSLWWPAPFAPES